MRRVLKGCALAVWAASVAYGQAASNFSTPAAQRAFINQYCAYCHNDQLKRGNMTLTALDLEHIGKTAELGEKAARKVRVGLMPPPGMPRPNATTVKAFAASLETSLDQAAAANPNPGRPALHRLNRTEYANSVRDLLDVRRGRLRAAAAGRHEPWVRQHGGRPDDVAGADGRLHPRGQPISREAVGDPSARALTTTYSDRPRGDADAPR